MALEEFLALLGEEINDHEEETFYLFSTETGSHRLGMIDGRAETLDVSIAGRDMTFQQSPGILTSNRSGGTTGAVVWKITPLFAEWMASSNLLFKHRILHDQSTILELGSGIAGLVGLVTAPKVARYILTDQEYALKLLKRNIETNTQAANRKPLSKHRKSKSDHRGLPGSIPEVLVLDWEESSLDDLPQVLGFTHSTGSEHDEVGLDAVIACDCIYNENLIEPFVRTCASLCRLGRESASAAHTICLIVQQLRTPDIFQTWLEVMARSFRVWRMPEKYLTKGLEESSGFTVHVAILRSDE